MTLHRNVRWVVLVGATAAAVAAPVAGAGVTPGTYVEIDGRLVAPQQLSAYEARAGSPRGSQLVQVAGKHVPPNRVSETQLQASRTSETHGSASAGDGLGSTGTAIEIGAIASLVLVAAALVAISRLGRLSGV